MAEYVGYSEWKCRNEVLRDCQIELNLGKKKFGNLHAEFIILNIPFCTTYSCGEEELGGKCFLFRPIVRKDVRTVKERSLYIYKLRF